MTSGVAVLVLLPLAWLMARAMRGQALAVAALIAIAAAVPFSLAHVAIMAGLRVLIGGHDAAFPWSFANVAYEYRKDVLTFLLITAALRLAMRSTAIPLVTPAAPPASLWLRDGTTSVRVDPAAIAWVGSAGNYVAYRLADGREHLIRGTLQEQEARLAKHDIVRVHRTRLVNLRRAIKIAGRPSGDVAITLDTGETLAGSRRYRHALPAERVTDRDTSHERADQPLAPTPRRSM